MTLITNYAQGFYNLACQFAFLYPLVMAYIWMAGAFLYYWRYERKKPSYDEPPELPSYPLVSILVPCYNEKKNVYSTFEALREIHYPNYEIIAINDGSKDDTGDRLNQIAETIPNMRVVHLATNQGKAKALKTASFAAKGEFLVCIDCDAILDHYAVTWIMSHFLSSPRVGAVTGNPRIRNRGSFLGRVQVGEFSAIIGLLKRSQRIYGRIFTISGVIGGFRRSALHQVGYWSSDTQTEDIDISWRLQLGYWDIRFEPRAWVWILMPETFKGLYKQRLRWAVGGGQAMKKYLGVMMDWKKRRMWGVLIEYFCSIAWSYTMLGMLLAWLYLVAWNLYYGNYNDIYFEPIPQWQGAMLAMTCLFQFAMSLYIDRRYDRGMFWVYLDTVWYPIFYWALNWIVAVMAFPRALFKKSAGSGHWVTVDRGVSN